MDKLSISEFIVISNCVEQFTIHCCQICGRPSTSLKLALKTQVLNFFIFLNFLFPPPSLSPDHLISNASHCILFFQFQATKIVNKFHEERKTKLRFLFGIF